MHQYRTCRATPIGTAHRKVSRSGGIIHQTMPENSKPSNQKIELTSKFHSPSVRHKSSGAQSYLPIMKMTSMPRPGIIAKKAASTGERANSQQPRKATSPITVQDGASRGVAALYYNGLRSRVLSYVKGRPSQPRRAAGRAIQRSAWLTRLTCRNASRMAHQPQPASHGLWGRLWGAPGITSLIALMLLLLLLQTSPVREHLVHFAAAGQETPPTSPSHQSSPAEPPPSPSYPTSPSHGDESKSRFFRTVRDSCNRLVVWMVWVIKASHPDLRRCTGHLDCELGQARTCAPD